MGFMDDLQAHIGSNACKFTRWIETIDPDYRKEVEQAIAENYPSKTIWRVIVQREGMIFSDSVLLRHMRGECSCGIQG